MVSWRFAHGSSEALVVTEDRLRAPFSTTLLSVEPLRLMFALEESFKSVPKCLKGKIIEAGDSQSARTPGKSVTKERGRPCLPGLIHLLAENATADRDCASTRGASVFFRDAPCRLFKPPVWAFLLTQRESRFLEAVPSLQIRVATHVSGRCCEHRTGQRGSAQLFKAEIAVED